MAFIGLSLNCKWRIISWSFKIRKIEVPFSSQYEAKIAYEVLRVDEEPPRSQVSKYIEIDENILHVFFNAPSYHQLRTGVNGFLDSLLLIIETLMSFGPPVSTEYIHCS